MRLNQRFHIALFLFCSYATFCSADSVILDFPLNDAPIGSYDVGVSLTPSSELVTHFDIRLENDLGIGEVTVGNAQNLPNATPFLGSRSFGVTDNPGLFSPGVPRWIFSREIERIQFGYYDQRGDNDGDVLIRGYDEFDNLIVDLADNYGSSAGRLSPIIDAKGVQYFTLETTGSNTNSLSWSIALIEVTAVPEPGSAVFILCITSAATMVTRRKRNNIRI